MPTTPAYTIHDNANGIVRSITDWPGGGVVGIHGTNRPRLTPGQISHGRIRLRNRDILRLGKRLQIGTPITIT